MDFICCWRTWYVDMALIKLMLHFQLTESPFSQYFVKETKAQALSQLPYDQEGLVCWEQRWTWVGWGRLPASPACAAVSSQPQKLLGCPPQAAPELCRLLSFPHSHLPSAPKFPDCTMSESTRARLAYDPAAEEWRSKGSVWTVAIIRVRKRSYTSGQLGYFLCATHSVRFPLAHKGKIINTNLRDKGCIS